MSFTYNLANDLGKIRRDIRDVVAADAFFTDEELQSYLDDGGNVKAAAGLALMTWAAALATEDEQVKAGSWQGDRRDASAKMLKIARTYLDLGGYEPTATLPTFRSAAVDWGASVQAERIVQDEEE